MFNKQSKSSERWAHFLADFFVIIGRLLNVVKLYWNDIATVALISKIFALSRRSSRLQCRRKLPTYTEAQRCWLNIQFPHPKRSLWDWFTLLAQLISLLLRQYCICNNPLNIRYSTLVPCATLPVEALMDFLYFINLLYLVTALHYNRSWHRTIHAPLFKSF